MTDEVKLRGFGVIHPDSIGDTVRSKSKSNSYIIPGYAECDQIVVLSRAISV